MTEPKTPRPGSGREPSLSPEQYYVMRERGTERPFSSPLNAEKRSGIFVCAACGNPLFQSSNKFESGTGWPSFDISLPGAIATQEDSSHGMRRTEYHCAKCGSHQGHIFEYGRTATGRRYCNNGVALRFDAQG